MAKQITREADAKKLLVPKGWSWSPLSDRLGPESTPNGVWVWGFLKKNSDVSIAEALSNLCVLMNTYMVSIRVQQWGGTMAGGKGPIAITIKPLDSDTLSAWRSLGENSVDIEYEIYSRGSASGRVAFNLGGWEHPDGTQIEPGQYIHRGNVLKCSICGYIGAELVAEDSTSSTLFCRNCVRVCPGNNGERCTRIYSNLEWHGCEEHFPRENCAHCEVLCELQNMHEHNGRRYCRSCTDSICARCQQIGTFDPRNMDHLRDGRQYFQVCTACVPAAKKLIGQDRNERVILEKPVSLMLPSHTRRDIRLCSVELELTSGALSVLNTLYTKALTRTKSMAQHWRGDDTDFCYMEFDGSLPEGGGELIFPKMRLDDEAVADKVAQAIGIVRKHVKDGSANIDLAAGLHVHIDAHKYGFNHVRNLVVLFNYLEDVIYRLSAANYTRHRGTYYAMVMPKVGIATQEEFNRSFFQSQGGNQHSQAHHSVLNVGNFYQAVGNGCSCGNVVAGNPQDCDCRLGKCTIEFRVFNSTSSWKKLHAYLALCQSMVAWAHENEVIDQDDFPPGLFNALVNVDSNLTDQWYDRLSWMFTNLYFTDEERESLMYCVTHSELNQMSFAQRSALSRLGYTGRTYRRSKPAKKETPVSPYGPGKKRLSGTSRYASQGPPLVYTWHDENTLHVQPVRALGEDGDGNNNTL